MLGLILAASLLGQCPGGTCGVSYVRSYAYPVTYTYSAPVAYTYTYSAPVAYTYTYARPVTYQAAAPVVYRTPVAVQSRPVIYMSPVTTNVRYTGVSGPCPGGVCLIR